jgi:hypothetical protein
MPQLRTIVNKPCGGAQVWDEEVTVEDRRDDVVAISLQSGSDLAALALAVGRQVWVSENRQNNSTTYLIVGKDGPNTFLAQVL